MKPVCLVMGAGAGIGGTVGQRFAQEGYHAVLCRRSDADGLNNMVAAIEAGGGSASGYLLNAAEEGSSGVSSACRMKELFLHANFRRLLLVFRVRINHARTFDFTEHRDVGSDGFVVGFCERLGVGGDHAHDRSFQVFQRGLDVQAFLLGTEIVCCVDK